IASLRALAVLALAGQHAAWTIAQRSLAAEPFILGLGPEQQEVVDTLTQHTGPEARILWECQSRPRTETHWPALLPFLTGRSYVGGLDPEATFLHARIGIIDQVLNEKHISSWSGVDLEDYCRQYNIGWVACWTSAVTKRFQQ